MPSISSNSLIVITGITGYIASHVVLLALRDGHRIRGTIRPTSLNKVDDLRAALIAQGLDRSVVAKNLEIFPVEDADLFSSFPDVWNRLFQGADGVEHIAFPIDGNFTHETIEKAVNATDVLLKVAAQIPTIKRFVITSTSMAAFMAPAYRDEIVTVDDWNEDAIKVSYKGDDITKYPILEKSGPFVPYAAAKALIEQTARKFVEKEKPGFELVTVLPGLTMGPVLYGKPSFTPGIVIGSLKNDTFWKPLVLPQSGGDVRDVAKIHYLSLTDKSAGGKRFFAAGYGWGPNTMFSILRKHFPEADVPADWEGGDADKQKWDNSESTALLGGEWISLEKAVLDTVSSVKA